MLEQALKIRNLTLRNRIVMPPMATRKAVNGILAEEQIEYYRARAKAVGMIILEHEYISPEGRASAGQMSMAEDAVIGHYRRLTEAVHAGGTVIMAQLNHAGGFAKDSGYENIAPSPIAIQPGMPVPREMTAADIERIILCFREAARRAKSAGFDGVEIHSAHGYLLNQFYSPLTNHRTDDYTGRTMGGRTRLHVEIIRAVRDEVGDDFAIGLRFGACDYMDGGSALTDIPAAAGIFEKAGIDLLDISGGHCRYLLKDRTEPGWFRDSSIPAKESVGIPVLLTGGVRTPEDGERLLAEGAADLIGVGRCLAQDADWAEKALEMS